MPAFVMKAKLFPALFLVSWFWLFSCKKDEPASGAGNYTEGVFIVNEGPFAGTGTITWHNPNTGETVQDVFGKANNGAALGQFVQSMTLHDGKAYIVVNGANKIVVVDAVTFQFLDTIGGFALPRFFFPTGNDEAFVSQWGADGLTGSIEWVNLTTNKIVASTPVGKGPEKIFRNSNRTIFVANSGGFGVDTTFTILPTSTANHYPVAGKNPACIGEIGTGPGSDMFVLCKGDYLAANPVGFLDHLEDSSVFNNDHAVPLFSDDLVSAPDRNSLYFTGGGAIYEVTATGFRKLFDQAAYGLGCDPVTGYLYCADAKDFNSSGEVVIYKPSGEKTGSFPVGIAPGEVVFIR